MEGTKLSCPVVKYSLYKRLCIPKYHRDLPNRYIFFNGVEFMRHFKDLFDRKYLKIASYAGITAILTFLIILLLYRTGPAASRFLHLILTILKPLIIGGVICYLLTPFVGIFDRTLQSRFPGKKWTRTLSVILCLLIIFGVILVFLILLIISMTKSISDIDFGTFSFLYQDTKTDFSATFRQIQGILTEQGIEINRIGRKLAGHVSTILSSTASALSAFFFGIIFGVYFLIDGTNIRRYWSNAVNTLYSDRTINLMKELALDADHCFSGYIRGQMVDALLVGSSVSIIFSLIGMPHAVTIGILTGVGNLIPYFGPVVGFLSVLVINLIQFDLKMLLMGVVILAGIMFIDSNLINPRLLAGTIEVHPLLVIASLLAGGAIGGLVGMLISVPSGAFLKMQFDKFLIWQKKRKEFFSENTNQPDDGQNPETDPETEKPI